MKRYAIFAVVEDNKGTDEHGKSLEYTVAELSKEIKRAIGTDLNLEVNSLRVILVHRGEEK